MKKRLLSLLTVAAALWFATGVSAAQGQYVSGTVGVDASWPNCSQPISKSAFGIVGVTGGKGFSQNSCLASEASHFSNLSLYVNTGYPGPLTNQTYPDAPKSCAPTDADCLAYNYGYNAGLYAVNYANSAGISTSRMWWLDVETMNTWTTDSLQNQNSLQGEADALTANGASGVGVYSTTVQWDSITNTWKNGWPSWGATTWNTAKQAAKYCTGHEFTGGPSYLMQFTPKRGLDQDYAC